MYLLAFDTSLTKTYVALSQNDKVLTSQIVESKDGVYHSEFLTEKISEILTQNSLELSQINAVITDIGPGSFTGIRTCNTVARMLAQQLDIDAIGVSSLELLASVSESSKPSLVLMDARKNKVYIASYSKEGKEILSPQAMMIEDALNLASKEDFNIIADSKITEILKQNRIDALNFEETDYDLGRNLLKLGYEHLERGGNFNFALLKPLYIQPPSITMPKSKIQSL